MTWGIELWDQFDLIANHTNAGIDFVEKIGKFVKERCEIESRYARELRKLAKSYLPKKKEEEEQIFTFQKAFSVVVKETDDLAGQHELISEKLLECVYRELHSLHSQIKNERRKNLSEGRKVQEALDQSLKALETSKKGYLKASEESDQASQAYHKADEDLANSRLQLEKYKAVSVEKGHARERAKDEYRNQLEKTNNKQTLHYNTEMPSVFDELQKMDEQRIQRTGELLMEYADVQTRIMPIIQKCLDNIKGYGKSVSGPQDSKLLCDHNKTEYEPPKDIQFEEYGKSQTLNRPPHSVEKKNKKKSTGIFSRRTKKHVDAGLDGGDQNLTPGEKIRKSRKKAEQLESQVAQLKAAREGMEKMVDVYRQNPSLGDANTIEQQLAENAKELDNLNVDLYKYQSYLAALENKDVPQAPEKFSKPGKVHPPPAPAVDQEDRPPSAPAPLPALLVPPDEEPPDDEFDEDVRCRVIYDFHATNGGELGICEGEELVVLEQDLDNSGWTKVLKGEDEGYVPSTYIEIL